MDVSSCLKNILPPGIQSCRPFAGVSIDLVPSPSTAKKCSYVGKTRLSTQHGLSQGFRPQQHGSANRSSSSVHPDLQLITTDCTAVTRQQENLCVAVTAQSETSQLCFSAALHWKVRTNFFSTNSEFRKGLICFSRAMIVRPVYMRMCTASYTIIYVNAHVHSQLHNHLCKCACAHPVTQSFM
jgi:hypothetical protein